jgi:hypothetical protein
MNRSGTLTWAFSLVLHMCRHPSERVCPEQMEEVTEDSVCWREFAEPTIQILDWHVLCKDRECKTSRMISSGFTQPRRLAGITTLFFVEINTPCQTALNHVRKLMREAKLHESIMEFYLPGRPKPILFCQEGRCESQRGGWFALETEPGTKSCSLKASSTRY